MVQHDCLTSQVDRDENESEHGDYLGKILAAAA